MRRSFVGFLPLEFSNRRQERVTCAKIALVDWLPREDTYPAIGRSRIRPVRQLSYVFRGQKPINEVCFYMSPQSVSTECCMTNTACLKCERAVKLGANRIAVCPQEGMKHVLNCFVLNYKAVNKDHSSVNSTPCCCHSALSPPALPIVVVL